MNFRATLATLGTTLALESCADVPTSSTPSLTQASASSFDANISTKADDTSFQIGDVLIGSDASSDSSNDEN